MNTIEDLTPVETISIQKRGVEAALSLARFRDGRIEFYDLRGERVRSDDGALARLFDALSGQVGR